MDRDRLLLAVPMAVFALVFIVCLCGAFSALIAAVGWWVVPVALVLLGGLTALSYRLLFWANV
jgi:hypothetical protein